MVNKELFVLNLSGELSKELTDYFAKKNIKVIDPIQSNERLEWSHILTKEIHDFSLINKTYKTIEKDVRIISLSKIHDPQNFILANGKLVLDEIWMQGPLGPFMLDKFFQEHTAITLGDNYPKFKEVGNFNIVNPFSTGDYLDRLIQNAFDGDHAALSIRTYFDHLLMFLIGLKTKGKAGIPLEVSYGYFDNVFALQIHFFADGLVMDDIISCFSTSISKKAEEYLLGIAVQSVDFFDFTFISQVNKVVVTGLWTRDEKIKLENRGMMFTSLASSAPILNLPFQGVTSNLIVENEINDNSNKVELPKKLVLADQSLSGADFGQAMAKNISSDMDMDKIKNIFSNEITDQESEKIVLNSSDDLNEMLNRVKGVFEEGSGITKVSGGKTTPDNFVQRISGGKLDVDNFVQRISGGIQNNSNGTLKVKSLGVKFESSLKTGLFDFAKKLNKPLEELSDEDLKNFSNLSLPSILKNEVDVSSDAVKEMLKELKTNLDRTLKKEFVADSVESIFSSIKTPQEEQRVKKVLIEALSSLFNSNMNLSGKALLTEADKSILIKSLSKLLSIDESKIKEMMDKSNVAATPSPVLSGELTENEKLLNQQLSMVGSENENLRNKITTLTSEVRILKDTKSQIAQLNALAKNAAKEMLLTSATSQEIEGSLIHVLQQKLTKSTDASEVQEFTQLLDLAKLKENEIKQMQIEVGQKAVFFEKEVEKMNRLVKSRDLMISKSKEAFQIMSEKKDVQMNDLKIRIDSLSANATAGASQASQLKELERQNQMLMKNIELYKTKLASLATHAEPIKTSETANKVELRRLELLNGQFKNQIESAKKELQRFQERTASDNTQINILKNEKSKLELEIKRLSLMMDKKPVAQQVSNEIEAEWKKTLNQNQILELQLRDTTNKLKEMEKKLSEAMRNPQKQANSEDATKKAVQLEANVRKLSQDLIESKNQHSEFKKEVNKLRQEKTSLQNQIDKFKKDQEKSGKASPPKKNSAA